MLTGGDLFGKRILIGVSPISTITSEPKIAIPFSTLFVFLSPLFAGNLTVNWSAFSKSKSKSSTSFGLTSSSSSSSSITKGFLTTTFLAFLLGGNSWLIIGLTISLGNFWVISVFCLTNNILRFQVS